MKLNDLQISNNRLFVTVEPNQPLTQNPLGLKLKRGDANHEKVFSRN